MTTQNLSSIYFPVSQTKTTELFKGFSFAGGITDAVLRTDTNKVLNVCSESYNLVSNEALFQPIYEELCTRFGEGMIKVNLTNIDDRKFYVSLVVNNRPYQVQKGDIVNPCVNLQNSYDGTLKFGVSVGFHRVVCSNGMMAFQEQASKDLKHTNERFDFGFLFKVLDKVDSQLERFKQLTERILTPKEIEHITEEIRANTEFPKRLIEEVPAVISREKALLNSPDNAWLLYHGFNHKLNHADIKMHPEFRVKIDSQVLNTIVKNTLN